MRTHADRLSEVRPEAADRPVADADRRGEPVREQLVRRLAELPPGHPSAPADKKKRADEPRRDESGEPSPDQTSDRGHPAISDERGGPGGPPDEGDRGFWAKVRHFQDLWRAHVERWPEKQDVKESHPDDPPGSWRGTGERYLSPKENTGADEQIDLLRKPEEAVTNLLQQIEHQNPHGAVLVGLEHRLKDTDRLKEKIADKMRFKGLDSPAQAIATINDAVRYTFCVSATEYVGGCSYAQRQLESAGCQMTYRKNHWIDDPDYKGVNTRWNAPDGGRFELQIHTRESFYAKEQLTHAPYERQRDPTVTRAEERELIAFQREVSATVPRPPGISEITDYRVRHDG